MEDMDMERVENIKVTEEMKQQEAEMLGEDMQQEAEVRKLEEIQKAQKTGAVDMSEKKSTKQNSANYTHKFSEPIEIMGKKYKEMTFYFDKLCGEDIEKIEAELQDQGKYVLSPEISSVFQSMLAARAAGIGADEIKRLKVRDYMKIKNKTRDFLTGMGY
jgi:hypothetical protein